MTIALEVRNLDKTFARNGAHPVLSRLSFSVGHGEFLAIVGASGCGKSTLLRLLAGLDEVTAGEILVDGRALAGPGPERGMVFQQSTLFPWLTVWENLRFPRRLRRTVWSPTAEVSRSAQRSEALLQLMGLSLVRDRYPAQLSGGMQQRVNIARALVANPAVLLMDEPFGALDAQTRETMHDLVLHLFARESTTTVLVTHDVDEAVYLGDRVMVLAPDPGRIDAVFDMPWAADRGQDLKMDPQFIAMKRAILERIRATTSVHTDHELLGRMTNP